MKALQLWLMRKYCPDFEAKMPEDELGTFQADAIITYGYWGDKFKVVASKVVEGKKNAYMTARWLALKAQWKRPTWLNDCGISYGVKPCGEVKHGS